MEAETDQCFASASEARNFIPYELSYRYPDRPFSGLYWAFELWVFWSRCDDELENVLWSLCTSPRAATFRNETIKQKIKTFLLDFRYPFLCSRKALIQFWAPVRIAHKTYLTTADQPFAIPQLRKSLFSYRKFCLENILIPVDGDEEHNLGPPGRVFRQGFSEFCEDISDYLNKEYLQRDCALELGLKFYTALPLFNSGEEECSGVLEIISESDIYSVIVHRVSPALKGHIVKSSEICSLLESICRRYELPLAQMWLTQMGGRSHMYRLLQMPKLNPEFLPLVEGQGVVGKAFSSRSSCFCDDISKLSINVYPMMPLARKLGLSSCFAICLKARHHDRFYIMEFFFPRSVIIDFRDPRNVVVKLVEDLAKEIGQTEDSYFQKLEKTLSVVVTKFSSEPDILHSFEIYATKSPPSVFKETQGMMKHDSFHLDVSRTDDEMISHRTKLHYRGETSGEPSIEPTAPIDEENIVQCARIKDDKNTLDVQYGITRDVLLQHSGKKLQFVANDLRGNHSILQYQLNFQEF